MQLNSMESGTHQQSQMQRRSSVPATVIVVDDDQNQLALLCSLLQKTGLNARGFNGAAEALEAMHTGQAPALIISDLCMPGIDGWQFCRLLRSSEYSAFNQVPVLVVSATSPGDEPGRIATALGVYAFLSSPFDNEGFIRQVLEILRGQLSSIPLRALIVEPVKQQAALLGNAFASEGYTTDTALTFQEAVDAFARNPSDIAVISSDMPDGSGDQLLKRIRTHRPECVCIMMTANPDPALSLDWMHCGAAACVRKPCEPSYLLNLCDQARKERALMRVEVLHETRTRQLRDNRSIFEALTSSEQDAIIMIDTNGAISFWNPAATALFDYDQHEVLGKDLHELLAPEKYHAACKKAFREFQKTGTGAAIGTMLELTARRRDGSESTIELSLSAIQLSDGWHAVGIIRDISERKQTEEALRESEMNLDGILSSIDAAVMSYSIKKERFLYLSPSTEKIFGRTIEHCLQNTFDVVDCIHPDDTGILHTITERMTDHGTAEGEYRIMRPDNSIVWVHARVKLIHDEHGEPDRIDRIITDITERKALELQLLQNQEQTADILDEIDDIVMSASFKTNTYNYLSPSFEKLFGSTAEQHLNNLHLWTESIHPEDIENLQSHAVKLGEKGLSACELRIIKPDGEIAWVRLRSKIITDENGCPDRLQRILSDITSQKLAEQEQEELRERLLKARKMESVARLAGGIAHDYNNILSVIMGHADLSLSSLTPAQPLHKSLSRIRQAAERASALTRQLLAFAGRQTIEPRALNLNKIIDTLLPAIRRIITGEINLVWQPGCEPARVTMDPSQIEQILSEVCQNARNALGNTGTITIATGSASINESLCARQPELIPGEYITMTISDDGHGMDKKTLDNILDPFFTFSATGTGGLGLATVYGILEQNNGFLNIASEPGIGTCITIYLPRCTDEVSARIEQNETAALAAQSTGTILLVEDEPENLELYRTMLESQGYTVLPANTPGECCNLAKSHNGPIDLLVTDVIMPETNGLELANEVHTIRPDTRCLFMSGYSADVIARHGILSPDINFIEKPFSLQSFTEKITAVLHGSNGK
jgi:two-component system, cell cycle sensor histidine kinase and response regulator CckA